MNQEGFAEEVDEHFAREAVYALEVMNYHKLDEVTLALAFHEPTGHLFTLVLLPGGPVIGMSPANGEGEAWLRSHFPDAEPGAVNGLAQWANTQQWTTFATARMLRQRVVVMHDH